jgi:hypothetical protein
MVLEIDHGIQSISTDTGKKLHLNMEYDQPTLPTRVDSTSSHDFVDFVFPSDEAILKVMASIDKPKDEVMHRPSCPNSEPMIFIMMSLDPRLGAYVGASSRPPSIDPFPP